MDRTRTIGDPLPVDPVGVLAFRLTFLIAFSPLIAFAAAGRALGRLGRGRRVRSGRSAIGGSVAR